MSIAPTSICIVAGHRQPKGPSKLLPLTLVIDLIGWKIPNLTAADSSTMSWLMLSDTQTLHIHAELCFAAVVDKCFTLTVVPPLRTPVRTTRCMVDFLMQGAAISCAF